MTQHPLPKTPPDVSSNGTDHVTTNDPELNSESSDKTIQQQNDELELHITKPGHEFNDKEILDKNADA